MSVFPIILDSQPAYLTGSSCRSLLLAPAGRDELLTHFYRATSDVTSERLIILSPFPPDEEYETALREAVDGEVETVTAMADFDHFLDRFETSDVFLLMNAVRLPTDLSEPARLMKAAGGQIHHLVAMERGEGGTREYAQLTADGGVRRIQRYYDGVTWLRVDGVAASLVPVSALRLIRGRPFTRLMELRQHLSSAGLPCHDMLLEEDLFDLNHPQDLLALNERAILREGSRPAERILGRVHPDAKLLGPVMVQEDAEVASGATILGPAVIGRDAIVDVGATVAQGLILPGVTVPPKEVVRQEVFNGKVRECAHRNKGHRRPIPRISLASTSADSQESEVSPTAGCRAGYPEVKRLIDIVLVTLGLVLISPLLLLAAFLVKLSSPGPILFGHEREGKDGKFFKCWKFRTMVKDADRMQRILREKNNVDGPQFKMDSDPRITRIGQFLRTSNIDELPQLFNVLLGEMSLIGPRPSPFRENQICVPWRQARLSVQPGITGLWQVCRHERSAGDFHQWIYYDMLYVRHLSFGLDVKILLATLLTFGGRWCVPLSSMIPPQEARNEVQPPLLTNLPPVLRESRVTGDGLQNAADK